MESTYNILDQQIKERLKGVNTYEPIDYNRSLGQLLDQYDIPVQAKLACLAIDTAMRHLDSITNKHLSKNAILIGDLLSAHFYTLLAELNEPQFQQQISSAIVRINELKSSIHQRVLSNEALLQAILTIESEFPMITLKYFSPHVDYEQVNQQIVTDLKAYHPSYLSQYSREELDAMLQELEARHI
ncbi:heptaprenyl pyrophosphate synthase subunit A [Staphylococcus pettenkoferi]